MFLKFYDFVYRSEQGADALGFEEHDVVESFLFIYVNPCAGVLVSFVAVKDAVVQGFAVLTGRSGLLILGVFSL